MYDFHSKSVVVAGGCGLIGETVVEAFREAGADVIIVDKRATIPVDISVPDFVCSLLADPPDVFVNCAYPKSITDHMLCYVDLAWNVAEAMSEAGGGSIVLFSSIYGIVGPDYRSYEGTDMDARPAYSAVKGAINAATRTIATRFAPKVRVNSIVAGGVRDNQPYSFVKDYCRRVPLGRMGTPGDLAPAVLFLASDHARYITGVNLPVDGGLTAW